MVTRMAQRTSQAFRVIGEEVRQDFEGYIPAELDIVSPVDLAHAALADEGGHVVVPESVTDVQGHGLLGPRDRVILRPSGQRLHGPAQNCPY